VPEEILYDRMKAVRHGTTKGVRSSRTQFLEFARYWGFKPRLCRPWTPNDSRCNRAARAATVPFWHTMQQRYILSLTQ